MLRNYYIQSLDKFIRDNPKINGLDTAYFRDFLIGLVDKESSYNPRAKQGSFYGWYQTKIPIGTDETTQHRKAFEHLARLFKDVISKEDVKKARSMNISDSALLLKYWNQENRVNNYLWNNKDSADGLGTRISTYGNDLKIPIDISRFAMDNLYGDYTIRGGDTFFDLQKRVRTPGRDYATGGKDLWNLMGLDPNKYGNLQIGQKLNFGENFNSSDFNNKVEQLKSISPKPNGLIYNMFHKTNKQAKKVDVSNLFVDANNARYPVENVKIYKPNTYNYKPEIEENLPQVDNTIVSQPIKTQAITQKGKITYSPNVDVGNMGELFNIMADEGISFKVTSGKRPGAKTKSGNVSHHENGNAADIVPIDGDYSSLFNKIKNSPKTIKYMQDNGFGILDESTREMQMITGATGPHVHIGKDKIAIEGLKKLLG